MNGVGMLTPEPTSGVVWNANRGAITLRVTVHGREAHVGLMHQGRNAFEDAIRVVAGLQKLARRVGRRRTQFRVTPDAARRSLMLIGGRVEAGSNFNVVPGQCVFTVDRRMNPEEDFDAERDALFEVFSEARRAGVSLDVETFQEGRPSGASERTPLGRALGTHVRAVTGRAPRFEMCPGLLEIRFYAETRHAGLCLRPRSALRRARTERVRAHGPDRRVRGCLFASRRDRAEVAPALTGESRRRDDTACCEPGLAAVAPATRIRRRSLTRHREHCRRPARRRYRSEPCSTSVTPTSPIAGEDVRGYSPMGGNFVNRIHRGTDRHEHTRQTIQALLS